MSEKSPAELQKVVADLSLAAEKERAATDAKAATGCCRINIFGLPPQQFAGLTQKSCDDLAAKTGGVSSWSPGGC